MICPRCRGERCRRSKRRGAKDYAIGAAGLRPWRCRSCELRFYAWSVALAFLFYAHCGKCGNFDLQRISREHVDGLERLVSANGCESPRIAARLAEIASFRCGLVAAFVRQEETGEPQTTSPG